MTTKEISVIEKQVSPVVKEASMLNITDATTMEIASILREKIKKAQSFVEEDKEKIYRPAKNVLDEINNRYKPYEKELDTALKLVNKKLVDFKTAEMKREEEEKAKIVARVGDGSGHLKPETAIKKMAEVEAAPEVELTGFTKKQVLEIFDESLIPREFLIPNETAIELALKSGISIPGTKLGVKLIPRTR